MTLPADPEAPVSAWPTLERLAQRYGVSTDYWDWQGRHVPTTVGTVSAVLAAFGVDASSEEAAHAALADAEDSPWRRMLPPVVVMRAGRSADVLVHVPHGRPVRLHVVTEDGDEVVPSQAEHLVEPRRVDGSLVGEARFTLPGGLPPGYHTLVATCEDRSAEALVVVAPDRLELPAHLGQQVWGLMTQLYSVRSASSWGLGDFADLAGLGRLGADLGADFVLVNPLHAAEPTVPVEDSPYLPTSRRFLNPAYLRVEDIPELAGLSPGDAARVRRAADRLRPGDEELLDRQTAWQEKLAALSLVFDVPRPADREAAFRAFREREGADLTGFATWCALAEHFGSPTSWPDWARDPADPGVADLTARLVDRVDLFAWLQWLCEEQLGAAQEAAKHAGMRVGLVTDLAVGVHPAGADVWTLGPALATGVNVGAPPDAFNQIGQDWSQPPWRPDVLAEQGYAPYRRILRTALRHAGAVRIDHVMGLFRLWCIPAGSPAADGAYLRYDFEAMVSILLLEAHRAGAFVVGEDLGVVEPFVREYLADRGVLGTSILWFEADQGRPRPPETWRELCLATVTTHDLPPTAGYLAFEHVLLRERLGLLTRPLEEELGVAAHERDAVVGELRERGLVGADPTEQELIEALHVLLAHAPSRLVGVAVTDLVGDRRTQNQPGTDEEYPNWRVPLTDHDGRPVLLEDLAEHPGAVALARRMRAAIGR